MKRVLQFQRTGGRGLWQLILAFEEHYGLDRPAALAFWGLLSFLPFLLMFAGLFGILADLVGGADPGPLLEVVVLGLRKVSPGSTPRSFAPSRPW